MRISERAKPSIFWIYVPLVLPLITWLVKYRFYDKTKIPLLGPLIISPNHNSHIDPVVMGVAVWHMGRNPRFMAKASILRVPVLGWFLKLSGQIPVERGGSMRSQASLKAARALAEKGQSVIIYPEGSLTRDPDNWPMRGKSGAVRLALEMGIPIVPIAHWGTQAVMGRYSKKISFWPRKTVDVKVGDPLDLSAYAGKPLTSTTLTAATNDLMNAITALLEDLRGEKAPATRWDPAAHNQTETGKF